VAGSTDFGSGAIAFQIGDLAVYDGAIWQKFDVIDNELPNSTTDDLAEGSSNLYFADARAKSAAVVNSTAGNETDQAASVDAMKAFVLAQSANIQVDLFTLSAGDITNGFVTLTVAPDQIIDVTPKGYPSQHPVDDFTVSGSVLTFAGDMLSLIAGDKLRIAYSV
jgi:hypothetical protein